MGLAKEIYRLTEYGVRSHLIEEEDRTYIINRYLDLFGVDEFVLSKEAQMEIANAELCLPAILEQLTDIAYEMGMMADNGITQRDLFDTKLMGVMTARPTEMICQFREHYAVDPQNATDWFYQFSQDTNYIRRDRIKKDRKWKVDSEYGEIDITINLSKPEKDPKAIAAAKNAVIQLVNCALKMKVMQVESITQQDRTIELYR